MKFIPLVFATLLIFSYSQISYLSENISDTTSSDQIDLIIYNGTIYTMEDQDPNVQSIAIQDNKIFKLGSYSDILKLAGSQTKLLDLQGSTLFPGFIDAHSHWIGDRALVGNNTASDAIENVLKSGWTSISELFVNQDRLTELRALDSANDLKLRVNAYMPLSWQLERFGDWYQQYPPGLEYSDHLRIAGVKIFLDNFPSGNLTLWFNQSEFTSLIKEVNDLGYQIAVHSMSSNATDIALNGFGQLVANSTIDVNAIHRHRIEHLLDVRPDQIQKLKYLNLIASFQLTWVNSDWNDYIPIYTSNNLNASNFGRWKDIVDAGIPSMGSTDYPWSEGPIGSIQRVLYSAVTRIGLSNNTPTDYMLDQRLSIDQVLKLITINAAYGTFQENVKGSIKEGKFADFTLLSKDPYQIQPNDLLQMDVIASIIDGNLSYCNSKYTNFCIFSLPQSSSSQFSSSQNSDTATIPGFELITIFVVIPLVLKYSKYQKN